MSEELVEEFITVESIFVRGRNCLALRSKFSPLFTDYYLHLMQYGLRNEELCDSLLKELMAYFTLYMVARPWAACLDSQSPDACRRQSVCHRFFPDGIRSGARLHTGH